MLGIVKGNKIIPLTTDTGTGAPVGTLIQQYKKKPMSGYLYCDGSTFDQNAYPALYMYLGSNVLPDYRECVMVGAEQNTTDTIETHDVYGEGEFKDDQLQDHKHDISRNAGGLPPYFYQNNGEGADYHGALTTTKTGQNATPIVTGSPASRRGDTTHGKQKAVYVYIKATSGLAENQQDNVLNNVKDYVDNSNSYSTQEVKTGGTWIDGKPIYRSILTTTEIINGGEIGWGGLQGAITSLNIDNCMNCHAVIEHNGMRHLQFMPDQNGFISYYSGVNVGTKVIMEYTKTTD